MKKTNGTKDNTAEPKQPPRVWKRVEARRLLCTLTPQELQRAGARLADTCEDYTNEEASQKDIKSQLKAKLEGLQARRNELATVVRRKADYKDVPVEIWYDYQRVIVEELRTDTGEMLLTRTMTDAERQMRMFTEEPPEEPEASAPEPPQLPPAPSA